MQFFDDGMQTSQSFGISFLLRHQSSRFVPDSAKRSKFITRALSGNMVDDRTDIFSRGVVLYEMSTEFRTFRGDFRVEISSSILRDALRPVTEVRADLNSLRTVK